MCVFHERFIMKKNLFRIGLASILAISLFFVSKATLFPSVSGDKEIHIIITVEQENQEPLVVLDDAYRTDAEYLGDLLEEISEKDNILIQYAGNKTDSFGRYIIGIGQYVTTDSAVGPWWLYNSSTNQSCITAGFCNGIDLQAIQDQDVFEFNFTSSY